MICASCPPWDRRVSSPWPPQIYSRPKWSDWWTQCGIASDSISPNPKTYPTLSYAILRLVPHLCIRLRAHEGSILRYLTLSDAILRPQFQRLLEQWPTDTILRPQFHRLLEQWPTKNIWIYIIYIVGIPTCNPHTLDNHGYLFMKSRGW